MRLIDPHALGFEVVRVNGEETIVMCPFHSDHSPSATFNMEKGLFHCFACGEGMGLRQLARSMDGDIVYITNPAMVAAKIQKDEGKEWHNLMYNPHAMFDPYLEKRKVSNSQVVKYGIRATSQGVFFPMKSLTGEITGFQIRKRVGRPKYLFEGKRQPVWPMEVVWGLKKGETLFVTEGVFGALRALRSGVKAVAVMGASSVKGAAEILNGRNLIGVFDDDYAGYLASAKWIAMGYKAAFPTFEADEASPETWREFAQHPTVSESVSDFADMVDNRERFEAIVYKFRNIWYNVTASSNLLPRYGDRQTDPRLSVTPL